MGDLIKALQIIQKYEDNQYPTNCSHDELRVCMEHPEKVCKEDVELLEKLGFSRCEDGFYSFRFGSC